MSFRSLVLVAHRWLGLSTALVLSIVGLTGGVTLWTADESRFQKIAVSLHERLAMGRVGHWIVVASSVVAVVAVLSGLFLWWKQKIVVVRPGSGWRRTMFELHHSIGVFCSVIMLLLAVTGIGIAIIPDDGTLRRIIGPLHTTYGYPFLIKLLYTIGTTAFVIQGATGVAMWWKTGRDEISRFPKKAACNPE